MHIAPATNAQLFGIQVANADAGGLNLMKFHNTFCFDQQLGSHRRRSQ